MSIFDSWDDVVVTAYRIPLQPNTVRLRHYTKTSRFGDKKYRRLVVSKNLIDETGAERFTLKNKGDTYALVPDDNGPLYYRSNKLLGISSIVLDEIVERIKTEECQASVIDGAIVFPIGNEFIVK